MIKELKGAILVISGPSGCGKSTLLNKIIGQRISIVTPKVQTTRSIITGVVTIGDTQLILFDTPGIFKAKKRLEKAMVKCAWSSLNSADIIVLILDSGAKIDEMMDTIILRIKELGKKVVFLLNKIDLHPKYYLDNLNYLIKNCPDSHKFNISALTGHGIDGFIEFLKNNAQKANWLYEKDDITNLSMRFLASEITREQLFLKLHQELPYNLTVENESWQNKSDGSVKINQTIIVSKESYKNMIIGQKGEKIKEIGTKARINIEELLGVKIHLFLFVKVRKSWEENPELYRSMGLKP
jgi:GTP-binding protein Era